MIDHLLRFASEAAAQADTIVGGYYMPASGDFAGGWRGDVCVAGVEVWQPSADTTSTVTGPDGQPVTVVTHHQITDTNGNPYWYVMIALPEMSADLRNHPTCMLVTDREKALRGDPTFLVYSPLPPSDLNTYQLQPVFAGALYPFGGVTL